MKFTKKSCLATILAILTIVPFVMLFLTCVISEGITKNYNYSAFDAFFGGATGLEFNGSGVFLIMFIVLIFIVSILKIFFNKGNVSRNLSILVVILSVVSAIFFFCSSTGVMIRTTYGEIADYSFKLGYAAIVGGASLALVAILSVLDILVLKD